MGSKLELIGINERNGLVTPNLYKQNWLIPSNTTNNYGVLHTRALSDTTTPIYGKGTGKFLDTANGGGDYDINGSINYAGSGRLNAISINTAQWSYGPATPYSVINTRALSDTITPVYGKGTGKFLDTANGGGDYDINGDQIKFPDSGRLKAISINTAQWSYGPATPYSVINTRALSDTITPVYGKGTGLFLDPDNGGGSYDINGDQIKFPGSGREASMKNNLAIWGFGKPYTENYTVSHPNAKADGDTKGKGTGDGISLDGTYAAHTNYAGGSSVDISGNTLYPGSGRIKSNLVNETAAATTVTVNANSTLTISGNKPFGYGFTDGKDYITTKPACSDTTNTTNVGKIKW